MAVRSLNILALCSVFLVNIPFAKLQSTEQGNYEHQNVETACNGGSIVVNVTVERAPTGNSWKTIPGGYQYFPGHGYYKFHAARQKWNAAVITCHNEGGYLAVPNSEDEAKVIVKSATAKYHFAYIGMYYNRTAQQWTTILDQPTTFLQWHFHEPDNMYLHENCAMIFSDGLIGDHGCPDPRPFFCELNGDNL